MKFTRVMTILMLIIGGELVVQMGQAQQAGTRRTDLQRQDLSIPGREAIQVRVDIGPGETAPRHTHPGEEIIYVLEGTLEYRVEHPRWRVYDVADAKLDCDIAGLHGKQFCDSLNCKPSSAFLAEGSAVTVYQGVHLTT